MSGTGQTAPVLLAAEPQLFVSDIHAACAFFTGTLGFRVEFLHGDPAFYGQVRRGGARLNLRHVDRPVLDRNRAVRESLLAASITVDGLAQLYAEFQSKSVRFHQELRKEPWDAWTFIVADPDGNLVLFTGRGE